MDGLLAALGGLWLVGTRVLDSSLIGFKKLYLVPFNPEAVPPEEAATPTFYSYCAYFLARMGCRYFELLMIFLAIASESSGKPSGALAEGPT